MAQMLAYPLTTAEQYGESMADSADSRPLNRPLLSWMAMHAFEGVPEAAHDPRVALLYVAREDLAGLPPALVITDERDVLRTQGQEFARHLEFAGVPVESAYYDGIMHDFFGAAAVLDKAEDAQLKAADLFIRAFGTSSTRERVGAVPAASLEKADADGKRLVRLALQPVFVLWAMFAGEII
jgi:acetyl esterase